MIAKNLIASSAFLVLFVFLWMAIHTKYILLDYLFTVMSIVLGTHILKHLNSKNNNNE